MWNPIPLRPLLAVVLLACAASSAHAAAPLVRNLDPLSRLNEFPVPANGIKWPYSSCWAYAHGDGREYAMLGVSNGTAIYNVTNPVAPYRVAFIPGPPSIWREMKQYRSWIYIVTEGTGTGRGVQVVRMTNPEQPVLVTTYTGTFLRSHTVSVDTTRALLICNGTWNGTGSQTGVRVLSLANPEAPVEIGWWPGTSVPFGDSLYVHDTQVDGTTWWFSSIGAGILRMVDATDPAHPTLLHDFAYPLARTHSSWIGTDRRYVYACNEDNGLPITIVDVQDPANMQVVGGFSSNPAAIMHNPRVLGSELWVAAYTEGVRVFDLTDPLRPALCAWGDSYAGPSGGYNGVWDVCPYLPSGTVVASDMNTGLYVYRPLRRHCLLWVRVRDALTRRPLAEVSATLAAEPLSSTTAADGYCTLAPMPGKDTLIVRAFGYETARDLFAAAPGTRDTLDVALMPLPTLDVSVQVTHAVTFAPLEGVHVEFSGTPLHEHSGSDGTVSFPAAPLQRYTVQVTAPGFVSRTFPWWPSAAPLQVPLTPVPVWDPLEQPNGGWLVGSEGDNATSGLWTRVVPLGTGPRPGHPSPHALRRAPGLIPRELPGPLHEDHETPTQGNAAPYADNTPGAGVFCFVTGQGTDSTNWDEADVDGGRTTLTSPWFPLAGMSRPMLSVWRWFHSYDALDTEQPDPSDSLAIWLTRDGVQWVLAETIHGVAHTWRESRFDVTALLGPSGFVRMRVTATDGGLPSTVEAAVDDLALWDDVAPSLSVETPAPGLRLGPASPNPARAEVSFTLVAPEPMSARLEILDVTGRVVHSASRVLPAGPSAWRWDGRQRGALQPPGVYLARLRVGGEERVQRFVLAR